MRSVMEVNFFAPVELIRLAIPHMTKGNEPVIVNVSSMCGRRAMPAWPEYSASKFALCGMSEALRAEMARFDIDVVLVVPGLTKTNLRNNMARNEGKAKIDFAAGMTPEASGRQDRKSDYQKKAGGRHRLRCPLDAAHASLVSAPARSVDLPEGEETLCGGTLARTCKREAGFSSLATSG